MFQKVMIGIDGPGKGHDLIGAARALAPSAQRVLVTVYPCSELGGPPDLTAYVELLRDDALALLAGERAATGDLHAETRAIGDPSAAHGLKHFAAEQHADLLIVGSASHGAVGRLVLGDVSRGVLHGAPCPVLVTTRGWSAGAAAPAVIGVAYDGSPESERALDVAVALATDLGVRLEIVKALDVEVLPAVWGLHVSEYLEGLLGPAQERLDALATALDVHAEAHVIKGRIPTVLRDLAARVDLMVCGSRDWGPAARVAFGSTADRLIHHSPCSVLVVPRGAETAPSLRRPEWSGAEQPPTSREVLRRSTQRDSCSAPMAPSALRATVQFIDQGADMFHKVIIGVDGLDATRDTIAYARALAPEAEFVLTCAYPYQDLPVRSALLGYSQALRELTVAMLEREAPAAGLVGAEYVAIANPSAGRALRGLAAARGADLIVVGSASHGAVGRLLLGDVSRSVLHGAPCPVAVVPRGAPATAPPTTIGVAFDGTPESREALSLATQLAKESGAGLELVDAIDAGALAGGWSTEVAHYMEERRVHVQQRLDFEVEQLPVPATATATVGSVAQILGELSGRVQLVVCGSRGWGPLAAVTLGSAADRLIHDAHCPVLVVPRAVSDLRVVADADAGHASVQG